MSTLLKNTRKFRGPVSTQVTVTGTPAEILQAQVQVAQERVQALPEIELLRTVPGIEPFLRIVDLIPDLIYIYQLAGVQATTDHVFGNDREISREILDIFSRNTLHTTVMKIAETFRHRSQQSISDEQILQFINEKGLAVLATYVAAADPKNPASIVFMHPSQAAFADVKKVEIELLESDLDIEERTDIQCTCGKSKVRYVPVQLRRADEGSSYRVTCVACKKVWIIN